MATKPLQSITFPGLPDTYTVPSKAEDVGAASLEYARQIGNPRNLLDNSDFTNPVNQRNITDGNITNAYWIDRWKIMNIGRVAFNSDYIAIYADQNYPVYLRQIFERPVKIPCTLAITTPNGVMVALFTGAGTVALNNEITAQLGGEATQISVILPVGVNLSIVNIALYEGKYTAETLPKYQPKGYAAELLECQRYFLKIVDTDTINLFAAMAYATTDATTFVPTPILMRVNPTISWEKLYLRNGTTDVAVTSIGQPYQYGSGIYMRLTTGGSLTKGNLYMVRPISGKMSFSADL